eukprot:CAMPEP_0183719280 /NCGR_PEP_ID=MMETSP0737-20130205/12295_1 /TAXON_ID=385413 /ORGANISM="Thalassiosira miniscula, Strain CCMP1093" /LENGTH=629 /DNA_ID=CAMNT_0025948995 /DNA_START=4 /DNA_END=1893 /DNA_ORIENTATION=+
MTRRPNIVLLITDQERSHKHWPAGWAEKNLTNHYDRLIGCQGGKKNNNRSSVVFPNAFTATTECSPSRASLLTSSYPTEHGVKTTPGSLDPRWDIGWGLVPEGITDDDLDKMDPKRPNLLRLLSAHTDGDEGSIEQQGYDVAWKGKWHLTPPMPPSSRHSAKSSSESSILKWYGATAPWNPPDAGHSLSYSKTLGGGRKYNHDGRFLRGFKNRFDTTLQNSGSDVRVFNELTRKMIDPHAISSDEDSDSATSEDDEEECIFDFLARHTLPGSKEGGDNETGSDDQADSSSRPFFLIASLVNPHDVWASSCFSNLTDDEFEKETGYHPREFESLPIELPPNHKDDLSTKPVIQEILRGHPTFGDLSTKTNEDDAQQHQQRQSDALRYIRFYAHLHKVVDAEIGSLLEALDATGQMDNTIIVRMADHGELALSHGLREKRMQCYEETMGIPLVINHPSGWFDGPLNDANMAGSQSSSTLSVPNLISSIDILPTIAEMAGVDCSRFNYRGKSLVPYLRSGNKSAVEVEEEILFTFDEPLAPPGIPGYVRCIRTSDYKYAVYFTIDGKITEYEMYDLKADPYEMVNLCGPDVEPDNRWNVYHDRLMKLMVKMGAVPDEFDWEVMTKPRKYSWG